MNKSKYRFHLYRNHSDASPCMSGYCYKLEAGQYGFWITFKEGGNLTFQDNIAYAILEELG